MGPERLKLDAAAGQSLGPLMAIGSSLTSASASETSQQPPDRAGKVPAHREPSNESNLPVQSKYQTKTASDYFTSLNSEV